MTTGLDLKEKPLSSNESDQTNTFDNHLKSALLSPQVPRDEAFDSHKTKIAQSEIIQFQEKSNPFNIYGEGNQSFHGIWLNNDCATGEINTKGIGWQETIRTIGNRENVYQLLDVLAYCFERSAKIYPWKSQTPGFHVEKDVPGLMGQSNALGIPVSYELCIIPLAKAIKNQDPEELKRQLALIESSFIHERAHNEFDQIGFVSPEAVSQGCQFLSNPGNNHYFNSNIFTAGFLRAESILRKSAKTNRFNDYELGNIVWSVHIYEQMTQLYPQIFKPLNSSAEDSLKQLIQLPSLFRTLKQELKEDEWLLLQKQLMQSLLEYDLEDQGKIIDDFPKKASQYGLDFIANPDPNY